MYLLDTDVISVLRKADGRRANRNVIDWLSGVDAATIDRRDTAQGGRLRARMNNHILPEFADRTLPVDTDAALRCAALHVPDPDSEHEAFIAATALVHGMAIFTCNLTGFKAAAVTLLSPWSATQ